MSRSISDMALAIRGSSMLGMPASSIPGSPEGSMPSPPSPVAAGSGAPLRKANRLISLVKRLLPHLGHAGVCDGAMRLLRKL